ncbi:MAG: hypothetical protein Q9191_005846 [Dirinaria sp. TL-2023a]
MAARQGNRKDIDGASLHTDDTDVESYYTDAGEAPECHDSASPEPASSCNACDRPDDDWMIQCERPAHDENEGWYHYSCAGVTENALPDDWFCPLCRPRCQFLNVSGRPTVGGKGIALPSKAELEPSGDTSDADEEINGNNKKQETLSDDYPKASQNAQEASTSPTLPTPARSSVETDSASESEYEPETTKKANGNKKKGVAASRQHPKTSHNAQRARLPVVSTATNSPTPAKAVPETKTASASEPKPKKVRKRAWDDEVEWQAIYILMAEMLHNEETEGSWVRTEAKWEVIAKRLEDRFFYVREAVSLKLWWGRKGRQMFDLDERKKPNATKMVTSVEDRASRKRRREEQKRKRNDDDTSEYESRTKKFPRHVGVNPDSEGLTDELTDNRPTKHPNKRKRDEDDTGEHEQGANKFPRHIDFNPDREELTNTPMHSQPLKKTSNRKKHDDPSSVNRSLINRHSHLVNANPGREQFTNEVMGDQRVNKRKRGDKDSRPIH